MGKITAVNSENVAEFVKGRPALGSEVKAEKPAEQLAEPPKEEVKTEGKTEVETEKPKKNGVQERIDELTRQKKELDEFAQTEYEARLQAQRRIDELERQLQANQSPPPKEEPEPDPTKYEDQKLFLKDWGEWNRKKAISDFQAEENKRRQKEMEQNLMAELETKRLKSLELARKDFPDFDEKINEAMRSVEAKRLVSPSPQIQVLLAESDYSAHILYHLATHPEEVTKLNGMRPGAAAIAIGRLENQFIKPGEAQKATSTETLKPNLPEPTPTLGTGGGNVVTDLSQPMDYADYKRRRLEENRRKRGRG